MDKDTALWHSISWGETADVLTSDSKNGLSREEAQSRQTRYGKNKLPEEKLVPPVLIYLGQFKSPLVYILVIAGVITLVFHKFADTVVIFGAVFLNTVVGYFQELKADKALKALKEIVRIRARVLREGAEHEIDSEELVPGDIIVLEPGDKVPADGRILSSHDLKTNEAVLTGEWLLAAKDPVLLAQDTPLADRDNMVYMGTTVEEGWGRVIVVATGQNTEIGRIAFSIKETKAEKTPLQRKLSGFTRFLGVALIFLSFLVFLVGALSGRDVLIMFETAVAVAVAGIPESLPAATTVILAIGMQRILRKKGLVRRLVAAETLGSTSVIATDKTLTLTEGRMEIVKTVTLQKEITREYAVKWADAFEAKKDQTQILTVTGAVLTSKAFIENPQDLLHLWRVRGGPTDKAFVAGGAAVGLDKIALEGEYQKIDELPVDSIRKYGAVLCENKGEYFLLATGAPEKILLLSEYVQTDRGRVSMGGEHTAELRRIMEDLAASGLRVIAVAYKKDKVLPPGKLHDDHLHDLIFLGFIGLEDPLRPEAKEAIGICRSAGMRPIIVTGDHLLTAKAVAKELGLAVADKNCMTGENLDHISDEEFAKHIKNVDIYARVEPRHKLRIVEAWQKLGEVVAMTGDGINDAPALKKADIGVALGSGTDVAKEVADLILLTDSFNVIVAAVQEGRVIIDNLRKVITYLLSSVFTETILVGGSILLGLPLPVAAAQILWVNLLIDGLPGLALAFEKKEKDVMDRKPESRNAHLITSQMKVIILIIGVITDFVLFGIFLWLFAKFGQEQHRYVQTMMFVGLAIASLLYMFSCKSLRRNIWQINPFSNWLLILGWLIGVVMLAGAVYVPFLQVMLKTVPLSLGDWMLLGGFGFLNVVLIEAAKSYFMVKDRKITI